MEHIRCTTERVLRDWSQRGCLYKDKMIMDGLRRILTKKEQRHITYHSLKKNGVITLGVDSSVWLYLLNLKKRQLLKSLNQILGSNKEIVSIVFRLDVN